MKKFLAMLLALCMALSLVACGGGSSSSSTEAPATDDKGIVEGSNKSASGETDKDVYIDFWGVWANDNYRAVYWQEKAAEFCEKYEAETGISVQFEYFGQGGYGAVSEKLAGGSVTKELPVISQVEEQATARFYPLAADLSNYLSAEAIDNYLDGLLVSCTHGGSLRAVPAGRSYMVCIVNKNLLEQAGHTVDELADWTWDEFYQIAKDITALGEDIYGHVQYWDEDAWTWETALYSNGGAVDNEDGTQIVFNVETGAPILNLSVKMMNEGISRSFYNDLAFTDQTDAIYPMFAEGKLGIYHGSITSYSAIRDYRDELGNDFELVVAKQPAGAGGFSVVTGGSNMMIMDSATETQKQVAAAFFEYLAQPENVAGWNQTSGYMAFTDSVVEDPAFAEITTNDPNLMNIYQFAEDAHARPTTPYWQDMYSNVLMPDIVDMCQNPQNYDEAAVNAMVESWVVDCQKIIDEGL